MTSEGVLFVAGNTVERSNPIRVTEPYDVIAFFHK